ncbi:hypothetical protein DPMN_055600 [Dreissena polymorpha]|uniref:Uncharacterized protein n=1 Tax=Dreissena polymorpha TaxID=45954 RepID=A0A9D4HSU6_DREPO|nr:hypothetical protein DPMN_055600 [Dreissena polymorpha]
MSTFCSQIMRQKSSNVVRNGSWVAMYSPRELYPCQQYNRNHQAIEGHGHGRSTT